MKASAAVFLSYAREDSEVVGLIAETLRAAGLEVWFDQNELVGGDAWDAKIRKQIKECALFVPIVSARTEARREGYFRIEWKLAAQRTHAIADGTPFLVPVVIDATGEGTALVPEEFRHVQWTRLPDGEVTAKFVERVKRLLGGEAAAVASPARAFEAGPARRDASATREASGFGLGRWLAVPPSARLTLFYSEIWVEMRRSPRFLELMKKNGWTDHYQTARATLERMHSAAGRK